MALSIIIKPHLTEKANKLASNPVLNQYTFVVSKSANKVEIAKAIRAQFDVEVVSVNTMVRPGKSRGRVVKGRMTSGRTSPYKLAVVTLKEGNYIDNYYGASVEETVVEEVEGEAQA